MRKVVKNLTVKQFLYYYCTSKFLQKITSERRKMMRQYRWQLWQLINKIGLRYDEARQLLRDNLENFPMYTVSQQIENLEKLGFNDAAGLKIDKITPRPNINHCGISKAHLPAYLVIPEQIVPLAKQFELLKVFPEYNLVIPGTVNNSPNIFKERPYWIFQVEIHGAGRAHKDCNIESLDKVDRCGLTLAEGLAVLRENKEMKEIIDCKHAIAFPGSKCEERHSAASTPIFRLPRPGRESADSIAKGREIMLVTGWDPDIPKEMETYLGVSEWSKTMIVSRAKKTF